MTGFLISSVGFARRINQRDKGEQWFSFRKKWMLQQLRRIWSHLRINHERIGRSRGTLMKSSLGRRSRVYHLLQSDAVPSADVG